MPTNAAVLSQFMNEGIYGKEAEHRLAAVLKTELGAGFEAGSDALQIFHGTATALAAGGEIRTNGGVKIYAVHMDSPAAATQDVIARFFNTSTASALLTTTGNSSGFYRLDVPCDKGKSQTVLLMPNSLAFQTAASYAVVQQGDGTTAAVAGSAPTVTVLYANI
jgi:hypothetical protein